MSLFINGPMGLQLSVNYDCPQLLWSCRGNGANRELYQGCFTAKPLTPSRAMILIL